MIAEAAKLVLISAALFGTVWFFAGRSVRAQRVVTLNELKYEIKRYSDDIMEVRREDGLHFTVQMKDGKIRLVTGTQTQLKDAEEQMRKALLSELSRGVL